MNWWCGQILGSAPWRYGGGPVIRRSAAALTIWGCDSFGDLGSLISGQPFIFTYQGWLFILQMGSTISLRQKSWYLVCFFEPLKLAAELLQHFECQLHKFLALNRRSQSNHWLSIHQVLANWNDLKLLGCGVLIPRVLAGEWLVCCWKSRHFHWQVLLSSEPVADTAVSVKKERPISVVLSSSYLFFSLTPIVLLAPHDWLQKLLINSQAVFLKICTVVFIFVDKICVAYSSKHHLSYAVQGDNALFFARVQDAACSSAHGAPCHKTTSQVWANVWCGSKICFTGDGKPWNAFRGTSQQKLISWFGSCSPVVKSHPQ